MYTGHKWVIDADLSKYFDTIPHDKLLKTVAERISDKAILRLIKAWLKAPIVEEGENGKRRTVGGGKKSRKGTPQGGVISPLLSNLYLHILDRIWERRDLARKYKARLVRYADDFVVLCREEVDRPLALIRRVLDRLELTLNATKTKVVNSSEESFEFLGFDFRERRSVKSGRLYAHAEPSRRSISSIKSEVKRLTTRERSVIPIEETIASLNKRLIGWTGYFHYGNCSSRLSHLRLFVEYRVAAYLGSKHKIRLFRGSTKEYPSKRLYNEFGLYKIPVTAGWKRARVSN